MGPPLAGEVYTDPDFIIGSFRSGLTQEVAVSEGANPETSTKQGGRCEIVGEFVVEVGLGDGGD